MIACGLKRKQLKPLPREKACPGVRVKETAALAARRHSRHTLRLPGPEAGRVTFCRGGRACMAFEPQRELLRRQAILLHRACGERVDR